MKKPDSLATAQINRRLKTLREAQPAATVRAGWIRTMRQALHMTLKQLAQRAELSLPTVAQAEQGEAEGRATLATLRKMAKAMDCELVYAFVPSKDVDQLLETAAREKARRMLTEADVHMELEDQRVEQSLDERVARLAAKFLEKGDVW